MKNRPIISYLNLIILLISFFLFHAHPASAHIRKYSFSDFSIKNRLINHEFRMTINDLNHIISMDVNEDGVVDQQEFEQSRRQIDEGLAPWMSTHFSVLNDAVACSSRYRGYELVEGNEVEVKMLYKCSGKANDLTIISTVFKEIDAKHMNWAKIRYEGEVKENVFREGKTAFSLLDFKKEETVTFAYDFKEFWQSGFETLMQRSDYILFTLALALIGNSLLAHGGALLAFFAGHLASFILFTGSSLPIPPRFTEILIVLSILFLCSENCFYEKSKKRSFFTFFPGFFFGLELTLFFTELAIPKEKLFLSVGAYSAGIGSAQLILIAITIVTMKILHQFSWHKRITQLTSFYVALFAFYFFLGKAL